jgi:hypothetical protein
MDSLEKRMTHGSLRQLTTPWLAAVLVLGGAMQACTKICSPGSINVDGSCKRMPLDAGAASKANSDSGSDAQATDASFAQSQTSPQHDAARPAEPEDAGQKEPSRETSHDAGNQGSAGRMSKSSSGVGGAAPAQTTADMPAVTDASVATRDQAEQDLGACPPTGGARLVTRHDVLALPAQGAQALQLLAIHCTSDTPTPMLLKAAFGVHNTGDGEATVKCVMTTPSSRDEASMTLPGQGVGLLTLQVANWSSSATPEPNGALSCGVIKGSSAVNAEAIRVVVKVPMKVSGVAAP